MVFSSITFLLYFLPAFLLCYLLLPWKNAVILVGSLLFYAWGEPRFVPLLLFSAVLNYSFGYAIDAQTRYRKAALAAGITINLLFLAYYKYIGFFARIANDIASVFGKAVGIPEILLPLGISFFTFQGISYLIDVYRREIGAQKSFLNFAMYKAMFPQLIAGPIVRYRDVASEIETRTVTNSAFIQGIQLFVIGLAQKVLIANTVAVPADRIFAIDPAQLSAVDAWIGVACYTVQIFYDFAGYSNMAIGIGRMLGFRYPINFNRPYSAASITDFWRRWHISLSSWFRDYLYVPLGGNRRTPVRTYANLALVFLLCGLWHGASWTFIVWGAWHGALLVVERMGLAKQLQRAPRVIAQAYTLLAVMIGWVFFRAPDMPYAFGYLQVMFGMPARPSAPMAWPMDFETSALVALVIGAALAVGSYVEPRRAVRAFCIGRVGTKAATTAYRAVGTVACIAALTLCVASLAAGTYNPFIYYRF